MTATDFQGFSKQTLPFFKDLSQNNNKLWFDQHRAEYEALVLKPARDLVGVLGSRLKTITPGIYADPRVNQSLFRLNRDTRFSPDKTPYKTNLALWFWEGSRPRMECSGFYFHLEPSRLMLEAGIYCFPKDLLEIYRRAVVHPLYGSDLQQTISDIRKIPGCDLGGNHYKKIPSGYDPHHPNAEFLLYNGLYAGLDLTPPRELFGPELVEFCFHHFQTMLPLHRWLFALTRRA